jgi:predicted Rossmann fold nucleotide-binding protein DprA/Smf involved in DNA uptake
MRELQERRAMLQPFVAELDDVDRAIKVLEKALAPSKASKRAAADGGTQRERVAAALRASLDPMNAATLADAAGVPRGSIYAVLGEMEKRGEVVKNGEGRYELPTASLEVVA